MRQIIGKEQRHEGRELRTFTVIGCDQCGRTVRERKSTKIQKLLDTPCRCERGPSKEYLESLQASFRADGRSDHPLYRKYQSMLNRCYDEQHKDFANYGGRGIQVCTRWIVDFWAYVEDLESLPRGPGEVSIDRVDNDGPYDPRNVRWASWKTQMNNRRSNRTFDLLTPAEAAEQLRLEQKIRQSKYYTPKPKAWWHDFGLKRNPYIYGPMPWKKTSDKFRRAEALASGVWNSKSAPRKGLK